MNALLLIAHGSRRTASNNEVIRLAERIRSLNSGEFDIVLPAFLEIAEPDIATGAERCVELGAKLVTVIPYFLSAGRHVVEDIPDALKRTQDRFPGVRFELKPHIGAMETMADMVLNVARSTNSRYG